MATIDHVTIRTSDLDASPKLFTQVFELLDFPGQRRDGGGFEWNDFSIAAADDEHEPTHNVHIGFAATSQSHVDNWWRALTAAGWRDDGPPGLRPEYSSSYYGAFIRDHDNNSIEAVTHDRVGPEGGAIDHLWIRVGDLDANKRFYNGIATGLGLRVRERADPDRIQLIAEDGSFTVLSDQPTENLHLAFGVDSKKAVSDFHEPGLPLADMTTADRGSGLNTIPATTALTSSIPLGTTSKPSSMTDPDRNLDVSKCPDGHNI